MFCENCGTKMSDGAKFCPNCGTPTEAANEESQSTNEVTDEAAAQNVAAETVQAEEKKSKKKRKVIGIVLMALCVVAVALVVLWQSGVLKHEHEWVAATCTRARYCRICGVEVGAPEHDWHPATCEMPEQCWQCGITRGAVSEHDKEWNEDNTVYACTMCGEMFGEALTIENWEKYLDVSFSESFRENKLGANTYQTVYMFSKSPEYKFYSSDGENAAIKAYGGTDLQHVVRYFFDIDLDENGTGECELYGYGASPEDVFEVREVSGYVTWD